MKISTVLAAAPDDDLIRLLACGFIEHPACELFRRHNSALYSRIATFCNGNEQKSEEIGLHIWLKLIEDCANYPFPEKLPQILIATAKSLHPELGREFVMAMSADTARPLEPSRTMEEDFLALVHDLDAAQTTRRQTIVARLAQGDSPMAVIETSLGEVGLAWLTTQNKEVAQESPPKPSWTRHFKLTNKDLSLLILSFFIGGAASHFYLVTQSSPTADAFVNIFQQSIDENQWPTITIRPGPGHSSPVQIQVSMPLLPPDLSQRVKLSDKPAEIAKKLPDRPAGLTWQIFSATPHSRQVRAWVNGLQHAMAPEHKPNRIVIEKDADLPSDTLRIEAPFTP
jgi:hypothetical protein